ncbi:Hypothetical predicted protein [Lecanosticta acicola]|uniref:Uncharacterized protein n=1 Tax=Lecanosticta acicola TaxID=111012 RepID=A0AAI8YZI3_9PEZI|nr:Hypothetical predicted protein [Lecanosticta acicola]
MDIPASSTATATSDPNLRHPILHGNFGALGSLFPILFIFISCSAWYWRQYKRRLQSYVPSLSDITDGERSAETGVRRGYYDHLPRIDGKVNEEAIPLAELSASSASERQSSEGTAVSQQSGDARKSSELPSGSNASGRQSSEETAVSQQSGDARKSSEVVDGSSSSSATDRRGSTSERSSGLEEEQDGDSLEG